MSSRRSFDDSLKPMSFNRPFNITETFKVYYGLTKPGIIYGNAITTAAVFSWPLTLRRRTPNHKTAFTFGYLLTR